MKQEIVTTFGYLRDIHCNQASNGGNENHAR